MPSHHQTKGARPGQGGICYTWAVCWAPGGLDIPHRASWPPGGETPTLLVPIFREEGTARRVTWNQEFGEAWIWLREAGEGAHGSLCPAGRDGLGFCRSLLQRVRCA